MAEQEKSASTVSSNIDKERSRKESNKPLKKEKNKVINTEFIEKVLQYRQKTLLSLSYQIVILTVRG